MTLWESKVWWLFGCSIVSEYLRRIFWEKVFYRKALRDGEGIVVTIFPYQRELAQA
jgi:hypothetical protein